MRHLLHLPREFCWRPPKRWPRNAVLTVYTYDSFRLGLGPRPRRGKAAFEETLCLRSANSLEPVMARRFWPGSSLKGRSQRSRRRSGAGHQPDCFGRRVRLCLPSMAKQRLVDVPNPFGEAGAWTDTHFLPYDWGYSSHLCMTMTDLRRAVEFLWKPRERLTSRSSFKTRGRPPPDWVC